MLKKILIGSPIHQKASILQYFLLSLEYLNTDGFEVHYLFIDDNESEDSRNILLDFAKRHHTAQILSSSDHQKYICDENTHYWNEHLIWKVAHFKNTIIHTAIQNNFDYLFLIDSDIVLHPNTLKQLLHANKDIISNIFWTKWQPDLPELPQVWLFDQYSQYYCKRGEKLSTEQIQQRHLQFLQTLKKPGIYEVGGLGACTLINRKALEAGVNFNEIKNVSFWGEDRHFCIRAQALGFDLFVDTHYPAFHIYRESDLKKAEEYLCQCVKSNVTEEFFLTIKESIESIGSFDYESGYGHLSTIHFSKQMREIVLNQIQSQLEENIARKLQVKATVDACKIKEIDVKRKKGIISFTITNNGTEQGVPFSEMFLCESEIIREGGKWFINSLLIKNDEKDITGYHLERKKKICLVYTNLSGSNTIALYKLIPEDIREEFDIKLLKQDLSQEYFKELIDSDAVVVTEGNYLLDKNKFNEKQLVIDTWHGFPLKAMGFVDKGEKYKDHIDKVWKNVDIITSYSKLFNHVMNQCINTNPNKYIVTGSPRNDFLYLCDGKHRLSKMVGKNLNGKKILLYMPTYRFTPRGNRYDGKREWNNLFDMSEFDNELFNNFLKNNDLLLLVKLHPAEESIVIDHIQENENIFILKSEMLEKNSVDLYEILNAVDLLITDYSSVYFDYLLLNRPMIFVPVDLHEYENTRGLLLEPYERWTPGSKVFDQHSLEEEILKSIYDDTYYRVEREYLCGLIHFYKDSMSTKRVWAVIKENLTKIHG